MDLHDQHCHDRPSSAKAAVGEPTKEASKGLAWWRPRRSNLADLSNTSSTSTSIISTSTSTSSSKHGRQDSPSSANRLLFDDPATGGEGGGAEAASGPPAAAAARPFETQQKPPQAAAGGKQLWTRGSREGTAAPSPEGGDDHANTDTNASFTTTLDAPSLFLPPAYSNGSTARRRRPQGDLLGSSSGKPKSLKLAPTGSANDATAAGAATAAAAADSSSPGTPVTIIGGSDTSDSTWTNSLGRAKGRRHEQEQQQRQQQHRWRSEERGRTPSKPPRPQREVRPPGAAGNNVEVDTDRSTAAKHGEKAAVAQGDAGSGGSSSSSSSSSSTDAAGTAVANAGSRRGGGTDGMVCDAGEAEAEAEADAWERMDDETAERFHAATERSVVYDILAVDRGCGFCDTSIVPFPVEEGGPVAAATMRDLTSGQSEFLARRGFAAGLVSHFLEETNCEFRVLQGGTSCGMTAHQLQEAAVRLEEAFVPAVKRLRGRASMDVVLDSLFEGKDDAGEFVVRFEVSITRCHPEDIESSPAPALQECARAIREAIREEGVPQQSTHEVVFVGRPMWELVSPVLDFSARAKEKAASSG